jgi:hypothetical protein
MVSESLGKKEKESDVEDKTVRGKEQAACGSCYISFDRGIPRPMTGRLSGCSLCPLAPSMGC